MGLHCRSVGSWMDISTECCTRWAQCVCGVLLLSAVVCGTFPHTHRSGSGLLRSTDVCQDWGIVRAVGRNPCTCCTCCVTKDHWELSACTRTQITVPLARLHLHHNTAKHGYSGVVKESTGEWNGALLSSMMRVGSICMRVMDVHVYGVDLVSIFRSAFTHDTQAPPQAWWCEGQSVTNHSQIWYFCRVK